MTTEIDLEKESTDLAERSMQLVIVDNESFEATAQMNIDLEKMKKVVKAYHKPLKEATHAAHKAATTREKTDLVPLEEAGKHIRSIRSAYVAKEEDKQRKKQAKLDEAAEKKAEKERQKILAKAEAEKDPEKKEELQEKAEEVYADPKIAESTVVKTEGISWVEDIEVTVTNVMDLLHQVSIGKIPVTVVEVKDGMLKKWAKTNAVINGQYPGINIKKIKTERVRTA